MRILYNGNIYTQDPNFPEVSAIGIDHGQVIAIGDDQQILDAYSYVRDIHDLQGATVIPGLTDSHIHLENYALGLQKIECEVPTKDECLRLVAEHARISKAGTWILGHGWNQNDWVDGYGTAEDLDEAAPDNPVFLSAKSLHSAWVNSQALIQAGIQSNTSAPPGGMIQRNVHGQPTGILFENATQLVSTVIPEPSIDDVIIAILEAQENLVGMGITGIHDFDGVRCFTALQAIQAGGNLKLRVTKSIPLDGLANAVDLGLRTGFGNNRLRIGGVKVFTDGALGPQTAAMIKPYDNDPDNLGMLIMDNEELFQHGAFAVRNGLSLAVHAIGDRANHETLTALERLIQFERSHKDQPDLRHRIEHVQVLHPEDVHRLADLNIIASMQPIHAVSDMVMADKLWGSRARYSYAWKSQLDHGAILAFGSDAPVESPNPFWGIHAAVSRQRADGHPGLQGWIPEQRLNIEEAIKAYTLGPAYAVGMERKLGSLGPGTLADLVVLDRDIFNCHPDEIRETKSLGTMIGGEWLSGDFYHRSYTT